LTKLAFPEVVARHDSSLFKQMQQLGVELQSLHPHEIAVRAIQSESPDFSLLERAAVIVCNKKSLPSIKIDRASVVSQFKCQSFRGETTLESLKLIDTTNLTLPVGLIKNLFPEAADIPAIARKWSQKEAEAKDFLKLISVPEIEHHEIDERLVECFLEAWSSLNTIDRIATLQHVGSKKDLAKQIKEQIEGLDVVLVDKEKDTWRSPEDVLSPKWAAQEPPNLPSSRLPEISDMTEEVITLWNDLCGLKSVSQVAEAVVSATKSEAPDNLTKAWGDLGRWLSKVISGREGDELLKTLASMSWVLARKGETREFRSSHEAVHHPGADVLAAEFWVVDGKLSRVITNHVEFRSIPPTSESIADIANCLSQGVLFSPHDTYHVYKLVDNLLEQDDELKEVWLKHSNEKPVYRMFREPEKMATGLELFLGDKQNSSDIGNLLWCFSDKAEGNEEFLKETKTIYRRLGVNTKPTVFHAIRALSKIEGEYGEHKEHYTSLINLFTREDSQQYDLEDEMVKNIRVLTCAETFERISDVYLDPELNKKEFLLESSRSFIINSRNRATRNLINWLNEVASDTIQKLDDKAEIELTSEPQIIEVSKSASIVLGPWKDWFEQLAFEGSEIRESLKKSFNFEPPTQTFELVPVKRISIKYRLSDSNEIIPSKEWDGPQALHNFEGSIFVLEHQIEKDYIGKLEELELLDSRVAEQVGKLLYQGVRHEDGTSYQRKEFVKITKDLVRKNIERPGVILGRLRKDKQDHFFYQYQDQTADPDFSDLFERHQRLSSNSPIKAEVENKLREIIKSRFLEERRQQIKGYGYDEFSVFAELIQNAEDAYLQRDVLGLDPPPHKKVLFEYRIDGMNEKSLVVEHFGRPFNLWRHGTKKIPNFKRDVEGVLRSAGSFKPHTPHTSDSEKPIGRFGLGFKSVYLITKKPRIHSGHCHFEIDSACVPFEVLTPPDLTPGATRFVLPLGEGVAEEYDQTGERLVSLMTFLRQVDQLELKNSNESMRRIQVEQAERLSPSDSNFTLEQLVLAKVEHVRGGKVTFLRFRNDENPAQLALYIDPEGFPAHWESAFISDVYTVLPLRTHLGCGLGVSHLFELQSGRTHLTDLKGNQERFEEVSGLIQVLPDALDVCAKKGKAPAEVALRFWSFLRWDQGDRDVDLLQKTIAAALVTLAKNSRVVPTLDPEKCTSMDEQTVFCFTGIPGEFQEELVQEEVNISVGKRTVTLRRDNVVSERFRRAYERTVKASELAEETSLTEIGWNEIGEVLIRNDLLAERPNLLIAMARSLPEEDVAKVKPWLSKCLFMAEDNSLQSVEDLLPNRFSGIDHLPKDRMNLLHKIYDQDAVSLLKKVGLSSRPPIDDVERWITDGLSCEEGLGLLRYLDEAGHWRRHYHGVGKLLREPWFEGGQKRLTSREANLSGLIPYDILADPEFRVWLGIFEEGSQPDSAPRPRSENDVSQILEKIHGWWESEGPEYTRHYEESIYPGNIMPQLKGEFFEKDGDERRGWLSLLILGCTYTMGWTDLRKQKTFLETCEKRGWMEIFSNPRSSADDWVYILDDYLNEQIEDAKWYSWMKQFISIYQISNYLSVYVNSFLSIEDRRGAFSLDLITQSGIDSETDRGGDQAPAVNRALGIGACFVLRELMRAGVLTNKHAYSHCYVPVKRVRDFFIEEFGCRNLLTEQRIVVSKVIHELIVKHLGSDRATFNMSFDLPFLILAENPDLKFKLLRISG